MNWVALRNHSYYSLMRSPSSPVKIVERCVQLGLPAVGLTDSGSITGAIAFIKAIKNVCQCGHHKNNHGDTKCYGSHKKCSCIKFEKTKIKPILGSEFFLEDGSYITLFAKNLDGWKTLIALTSEANKQENIHEGQPRIKLEKIAESCKGNLIGLSGLINSQITNNMFGDLNRYKLYLQNSYSDARNLVDKSKYKETVKLAHEYKNMFGKDNFYLETNTRDESFAGSILLSNAIRAIGREANIPCVASGESYYAQPDDFDDQRILLCSSLNVGYDSVDVKISQPGYVGLRKFFNSREYYIPSPDELMGKHTEIEIAHAMQIADQCENYDILSKPRFPVFKCPDGKNPDQYLRELCIKGWKEKISNCVPDDVFPAYKSEIKKELEVIQGAGLSSYFLIVEDYCRAAREMDQLIGPGRGSAAGCLISYLIGITKVDPVKYDLMFERFYNAGRNTADRVSLPDIDVDFENRDQVITYARNKYGTDHVSQMITFSRIQGRAALKEVFRVKYPNISIDEVNKITALLPDEAAIADKLQEMREAGEEPSIIMWALEANSKNLKEFCYIDNDGNLQGEYAPAFRQAVRLEGTKKSQSKHPSGIVISNEPLAEIVPMVYDKTSKQSVAGFEMYDLEDAGITKFDILEVGVLRKLHNVSKFLAGSPLD